VIGNTTGPGPKPTGLRVLPPVCRRQLLSVRVPALGDGHRGDLIMAASLIFDQEIGRLLSHFPLPRGGRIAVSELFYNVALHGGGGRMTVSMLRENGRRFLEILTEDQGPGIDDLPKLFKQSLWAHSEATRSEEAGELPEQTSGMGMLNICLRPDSFELESRGKRWVATQRTGFTAYPSEVTTGSRFRLLFILPDQ